MKQKIKELELSILSDLDILLKGGLDIKGKALKAVLEGQLLG